MAHETADDLKTNVANAFGIPAHLMAAFHAWIDSVEERLSGGKSTRPVLNREGDENVSGTTEEMPQSDPPVDPPMNPAGDPPADPQVEEDPPNPGSDQPPAA